MRVHWGLVCLLLLGVGACQDTARITVSGSFVEMGAFDPVPDVEICVFERPDLSCATSDTTGAFQIDLPPGVDLYLMATRSDFPRFLLPFPARSDDYAVPVPLAILPRALFDLGFGLLGISEEPGKGHFGVSVFAGPDVTTAPPRADVTITLPVEAGGTRYYVGDNGLMTTSITATTAAWGFGGYLNVTPGEWPLTASYPGGSCHGVYVFPAAPTDRFTLRIADGHSTWVTIYCE